MLFALPALALSLVLPLALVVVARSRVLAGRAGADPARVWFGYWQAASVAISCAWIGWVGGALAFHLPPVVARASTGLGLWLVPVAVTGALLAPPALVGIAVVALTHDVSARVRGEGWTRRETVMQAAWSYAGLVLPLMVLAPEMVAVPHGAWRVAALLALAALALVWICARRRGRALDLTPHAVTSGPLRDRVFALAGAAGVRLRMLYVMPTARGRVANAFAVRGGVVMITDHLLEHLSRRELDAVIAHELTHLRRGHPRLLMLPVFLVLTVVFFTTLTARALPGLVSPPAWVVGIAAMVAVSLVMRRRFEFDADRGAVELTRDPEALVSALAALARLNHMPLDWGGWSGAFLSHPSTARRARAIGRAAGLSPARVEDVMREGCGDTEHHEVPAAGGKVFSTRAKLASVAALGLTLAALLVAVPALVLALAPRLAPHAPRLGLLACAAAAAFAGALVAQDLLATRPYRRVRRELAARLAAEGLDMTGGRFVGLAPTDRVRVYEGHGDWDVGFLFVRGERLCYVGEETRFALERGQVLGVRLGARMPGWIVAPRVVLDLRDGAISLRDADIPRLSAGRDAAWRLLGQLGAWVDGLAEESAPPARSPLDALAPPALREVTALTPREAAGPHTLAPLAVRLGVLAAVGCALAGLGPGGAEGPGWLDVWTAAMAAAVVTRVPWWRWRERAAAPARARTEHREAA